MKLDDFCVTSQSTLMTRVLCLCTFWLSNNIHTINTQLFVSNICCLRACRWFRVVEIVVQRVDDQFLGRSYICRLAANRQVSRVTDELSIAASRQHEEFRCNQEEEVDDDLCVCVCVTSRVQLTYSKLRPVVAG